MEGWEKTLPYSVGFSMGLTAFAAVSLFIAAGKQIFEAGKQIAPYLIRR